MTAPVCSPELPEGTRNEFARIVSLLGPRATAVDAIALELLASSVALWKRCQADIEKLGPVVMSGGVAVANPAIAVAKEAQGQILAVSRELGLSAEIKRRMSL